jgi:hypothetical protein
MKKMKITIRKDGTQTIEVLGAVGEECVEFTRQLEQRLGTKDGERELKPEFCEIEPEVEREREGES